MSEYARMLDPAVQPDDNSVARWIGPQCSQRWSDITQFIASHYPDVFEVEWLFGGKKHGWLLRYKKSKSFCSMIPEQGQFRVLLIFGVQERPKVEALLPDLKSHARSDYENAITFHDGRWVTVLVDSDDVVADVERLLVLKRKPKAVSHPEGK